MSKPDLRSRWTALHVQPDKRETLFTSAVGRISESHLCVDCGVNTAPGAQNRKEAEISLLLSGGSPFTIGPDTEMYIVTDEVWKQSGLDGWGGCLCISCLEKRIGRRLKPVDFPDHPFNTLPATKRLLKRRGRQ
jgi:hypothetical protein